MFNTGARVQEILDLRVSDLQLIKPYQVRLVGKGHKYSKMRLYSVGYGLDFINFSTLISVAAATQHGSPGLRARELPWDRYGLSYFLERCPPDRIDLKNKFDPKVFKNLGNLKSINLSEGIWDQKMSSS